MRLIIFLILMPALCFGQFVQTVGMLNIPASAASTHSMSLTVNHTLCGTASSSNFPVLVKISDVTIKDVAHSGYVLNTSTSTNSVGLSIPNDIEFFSDAGLTTAMNWQLVYYDGTNGVLYAFVKITASNSSDLVFYLQCGSPSITSFQGGAASSTFVSYAGIWPLIESSNPYHDISGNSNNSTSGSYPTQVTGYIYKAQSFTTNYISVPTSASLALTNMTATFLYNHSASFPGAYETIMSKRGTGSATNYENGIDVSTHKWYMWGGGSYTASTSLPTVSTWQMQTIMSGTSGGSTFLLNNAGSNTTSINLGATNAVALNIGSCCGGAVGDQYWKGAIELIELSNVQRSTSFNTCTYNSRINAGNIGSAGFITYSSWTTP